MFHTFVPAEDVFRQGNEKYSITQHGAKWLCLRESENGKTVERLISTNPFDYLLPGYAPGKEYNQPNNK